MSTLNTMAQSLRALHKPGDPLVLANVYDAITAKTIVALPSTHVLATASWSIAAAAALNDNDLDMDTNIRAVEAVARIAKQTNKPLTVDFQDGYGDRLEEGIKKLLNLGVAGINLEDTNNATGKLYSVNEYADRLKSILKITAAAGAPDFVINARTDTLVHGNPIEDAILRGRAYLATGATNIFAWGGSARGGLSRFEVERLTEAFAGKLNVMVSLGPGSLTVGELKAIGVSRCSIGPALQFPAMKAFADEAVRYASS